MVKVTEETIDTAAGFLSERQDFLHVFVTRSVSGEGWDVVLRVDGTYPQKDVAEGAAVGIREWIERLTDVETSKRVWWDGPSWQSARD